MALLSAAYTASVFGAQENHPVVQSQKKGLLLNNQTAGINRCFKRLVATKPARAVLPVRSYQSDNAQTMYHTNDAPIAKFQLPPFPVDFYVISNRIGSGTFGQVFLATHKQTGDKFAVKKMPKRFNPDGTLERYYVRRVRNEIDIANHLGPSLNVAYMYGAYEDKDAVYLLMELCTGGELWDKIKVGSYSERDAARLVKEILRTVAQCHAAGVMIRDIKPENFLFASKEPDAPLKAIDFGISIFCQPGQWVDVRAGTPIYIAPEVLKCQYTLSADMWSVGIVAYQLLTGKLPFAGEEGLEVAEAFMTGEKCDNKDVFRAILYSDLDFETAAFSTLSDAAKDFLQSLLQREEFKRPSAEQALQHDWLLLEGVDAAPGAFDDGETEEQHMPLADSIVQRLQRYGTYGSLRQAALRKVAHAVADFKGKNVSNLPAALKLLSDLLPSESASSDGRVSVAALKSALQSGHFSLTDIEAEQLLRQVHAADDGTIDLDEWMAVMADWHAIRSSTDWDSVVEEVFNALDTEHRGKLTSTELELLLCGEEGCEAPAFVDSALREADYDHDGGISLEEFKELVSDRHDSRLDLFEARLAQNNNKNSDN